MRGGGPQTRGGGALRRQPAEGHRSPARSTATRKVLIAAQPTRGLDVGAIEFVHRRLVEERDEGRAILLVSLELEEILSLSDRILVMYEGEIVGEFPPTATEEELGLAMTGGGASRSGGVSTDGGRRAHRRGIEPVGLGARARAVQHRPATARRSAPGGILAPLLTALLAFFVGGLVVLVTTGKNPLTTYRAIFDGSGLNWFFQSRPRRHRLGRGVQPPADADRTRRRSILTGLAVAFAFRCGLFNIGGQGQYIVGQRSSRSGSARRSTGMNPFLHILLAIVVGTLAGALWAGIAGFLKATVGAHEVISTIMLNWIAIWVGVVPVRHRRAAPERRRQTSVPISNDIVESAKLRVFWGDPLLQGLHTASSSRSPRSSSTGSILNRTTLGYGVTRGRLQPRSRALRRHQRRAATTSSRWRSRARSPGSPARSTSSAGSSASRRATSRRARRSAFIGIAVALLGRNTAVGVFLAALLFGALLTGTSTRNLDPDVFQPELAVEPDAADPGPRRPLRRRRPHRPLAPRAHARETGGGMTSVALARRGPDAARAPRASPGSASSSASWRRCVALPPLTSRSWVPSLAARARSR